MASGIPARYTRNTSKTVARLKRVLTSGKSLLRNQSELSELLMNPNDYYRLKSAEITEADVRLVAACRATMLAKRTPWLEALVRGADSVNVGTRHSRNAGERIPVAYWSARRKSGALGSSLTTRNAGMWRTSY